MSAGGPAVRVLPPGAAWFPESISNGGAHYGELDGSGQVHGVCGAVFTPLPHPEREGPVWWRKPVDDDHACPPCREQLAASRHAPGLRV